MPVDVKEIYLAFLKRNSAVRIWSVETGLIWDPNPRYTYFVEIIEESGSKFFVTNMFHGVKMIYLHLLKEGWFLTKFHDKHFPEDLCFLLYNKNCTEKKIIRIVNADQVCKK